ncbi:STAS domain-containing protein [Asanoa sp. WMMD1127]|uniref:STAS domain-containing protein n=1 Tax=Asanoa sp. WMMD1127 TaxID=3016107 RepID=UPI002416FA7F|nr:STAS domain-containing protein [Asanoa sp. WMMD1127]MDG4826174.1 STAS domain-containing protein [Asanoa sp. WMMD1127]
MDWDCMVERTPDGIVVKPVGPLDLDSAAALRGVLQAAVKTGAHRVEVDLENVDFVDSTAIGVFVATRRAADDRAATFGLRNAGPMVRMVLQIANLTTLLAPDERPAAAAGSGA